MVPAFMLAMVSYWAVVLVVRIAWPVDSGAASVAVQFPWALAVTTASEASASGVVS